MVKRHSITNRQRLALRAHCKLKPHLTGSQLQKWFEEKYNQKITLSSISRITSSKYDWVDTAKDHQLDAKKKRTENWPKLEEALYEWILLKETEVLSQELIREKARQFWPSIYPGKDAPLFSNGWLYGFQSRRNIRSNSRHGEAGNISIDSDREMIRVHEMISQYSSKDIFNCDETGLCWRSIPDQSLLTNSVSGQKNNTSRITLHFCTNSDGSERLPLWIIGTGVKPRSFKKENVNLERLGCHWRHNKNATMTVKIFEEWLYWFNEEMTGRKVLLLMDNFSAHISVVREISPRLQNVSVAWLPANSTLKYQPLDQGIIHTWKAHWKCSWVLYMIKEFDSGNDPIATMTILKAIRWAIRAWNIQLSGETIENCFKNALAGQNNANLVETKVLQELQAGLDQLAMSNIKEVMEIDQFLNPAVEKVTDNLEGLDSIVLDHVSAQCAESDDENDDDDNCDDNVGDDDGDNVDGSFGGDKPIEDDPNISLDKALEAIYTIISFEERQNAWDPSFLNNLMQYRQRLITRKGKK